MGFLACGPFGLAAQQVFLGDHLEDGADILRHAAVDEDQRVLELLPRGGGGVVVVEDAVGRHQAAAADTEFGVAFAGDRAGDQLHTRPDAAGVLPTTAGASDPFAEQGAGEHDAAFVFGESAC